jgi:hypothetical protein
MIILARDMREKRVNRGNNPLHLLDITLKISIKKPLGHRIVGGHMCHVLKRPCKI